jgi:hypothetical protein
MRIPLNFCDGDGWLLPEARIGGEHRGQSWQWHGRKPVIACSNLRCARCGTEVLADSDAPESVRPDDAAERAADAAAANEAHLGIFRCHCSVAAIPFAVSTRAMREQGSELVLPPVHWVCGGHSPIALPAEIAGHVVSDADSLSDAIGALASSPGEAAHAAIAELVFTLQGGPLHDVALRVMRESVMHEELAIRSAAIHFWRLHPGEDDAGCLLRSLLHHRALFADVPDPTQPGSTLESALVRALSRRLFRTTTADSEVLQVLREFALRSADSDFVVGCLVEHDLDWVLQNAATLMSTTSVSASRLRLALKRRGIDPGRLPLDAILLSRTPGLA